VEIPEGATRAILEVGLDIPTGGVRVTNARKVIPITKSKPEKESTPKS
jgi:hypothetical protein